jgi:hypothetical protein
MVTLFQGDELVALRLTLGTVVVADEPHRRVHGVRATEREVHVVEITRRPISQFRRQARRWFAAQPEIPGRIGEFPHLPACCFHNAFVAVAGIDAPQAGKPVHQLATGGVGHPGALARLQQADARLFMAAPRGDGMNEMSPIEFNDGIGVHV